MQSITLESLFVGSFLTYKNHDKNNKKTTIVLLGQGWFAKGFLDHINSKKFYIKNITRHEFINTPMLLKSVNLDNNYTSNDRFKKKIDELIVDEITKIDLENKNLQLKQSNLSWKNGYLVCGLGSNEDIGKKWIEITNKIRLGTGRKSYCIIGSGPTGTELAFYLADKNNMVTIVDMINKEQTYNYLSKAGKKIILDKLKQSHIKLICGTPFTEEMKTKYNEVIFAIGSRPNDLTQGWKSTPKLNLENYDDVFFGGDCVHGSKLPRNAQVAYQQGKYIAERLNDNKENDFEYDNKGIAIYSGNSEYYVELSNNIKLMIPKIFVELYYTIFK